MVRDDDRHPVILVDLSSQLSNRRFRVEQGLRRKGSERENHPWPNQFYLPDQVRATRRNFFESGIAVTWWSVFQDIANENIAATEFDRLENLGQKFSGSADERASGFV